MALPCVACFCVLCLPIARLFSLTFTRLNIIIITPTNITTTTSILRLRLRLNRFFSITSIITTTIRLIRLVSLANHLHHPPHPPLLTHHHHAPNPHPSPPPPSQTAKGVFTWDDHVLFIKAIDVHRLDWAAVRTCCLMFVSWCLRMPSPTCLACGTTPPFTHTRPDPPHPHPANILTHRSPRRRASRRALSPATGRPGYGSRAP